MFNQYYNKLLKYNQLKEKEEKYYKNSPRRVYDKISYRN